MHQPVVTAELAKLHRRDLMRQAEQFRAGRRRRTLRRLRSGRPGPAA